MPKRHALAAMLPLLVLLAACGRSTGDVGLVEYNAPATAPALPARELVRGSESAALRGAVGDLERMGFQVDAVDESNGLLTATYLGDAGRFVDCGELRLGNEGSFQPAAAARLSFRAFPDQPSWVALRHMRLDARLIARTRSDGLDTRLNAMAAYVLTRTVDTIGNDGAVLGTVRETISFETGGVGRFDNGTICHPTGELERTVAGAMVAAAARVPTNPFDQPPYSGEDVPLTPRSLATSPSDPRSTVPAVADAQGVDPDMAAQATAAATDGITESELAAPDVEPASGGRPDGSGDLAAGAAAAADTGSQAGDTAAAAGAVAGAAGAATAGTLLPSDTDDTAMAAESADTASPAESADAAPAADIAQASLGTPQNFLASESCADAMLTTEANGDLRLVGYVAGSAERDRLLRGLVERAGDASLKDETRLLPSGSCEALRFLDDVAGSDIDGFSISLKDPSETVGEGTEVELVVSLPGDMRYFYVGYIEEDGRIHHLGPKFIDGSGIGDRFLYRTGHIVSAPAGTEMVVAIATSDQTLIDDRPPVENAAGFFIDLRNRAQGDPGTMSATKLIFETAPR
ncbi:MAG: hypothetical protein R3C70_08985 [Geminicoccaceae bacterium]